MARAICLVYWVLCVPQYLLCHGFLNSPSPSSSGSYDNQQFQALVHRVDAQDGHIASLESHNNLINTLVATLQQTINDQQQTMADLQQANSKNNYYISCSIAILCN
jgi:hypothetical protein